MSENARTIITCELIHPGLSSPPSPSSQGELQTVCRVPSPSPHCPTTQWTRPRLTWDALYTSQICGPVETCSRGNRMFLTRSNLLHSSSWPSTHHWTAPDPPSRQFMLPLQAQLEQQRQPFQVPRNTTRKNFKWKIKYTLYVYVYWKISSGSVLVNNSLLTGTLYNVGACVHGGCWLGSPGPIELIASQRLAIPAPRRRSGALRTA